MKSSDTRLLTLILLLTSFLLINCSPGKRKETRVLVFTKAAGFVHASIPDGVKAIQKLGEENNFLVDTTSDAGFFTEDTLKNYSAVIFMSTTGDVLNSRQQADFERYIQAGGGYVGVHAAADCEYHWPWYGKLVGAYFKDHPAGTPEARLTVVKDKNFPELDSLPNPWIRHDEWYNFREAPKDVHVLLQLDESSYEGGNMGADHPATWYHEYDGGRAFYTTLGHTSESYTEKPFLELLLGGIKYAIGDNRMPDYSKATSLRKPDDDRFTKVKLAGGLDEPTELTILPNMDIVVVERKGAIKYYNAKDSTIKEVAHLSVYSKALKVKGVNVETGLLGIQADPDFEKNNWLFIYYSPADKSVDRLSRFTFKDGQFDMNSEKVVLEVNTDREICCHTGGSIAFDKNGDLFLSTGDNTTPFDEVDPRTRKAYPFNSHGYSPLDDRPGFENYDDRRAAGNSNDLRGKILRIHVNDDGSYDIPDGNLFKKGEPGTRPEIYVMGCRNPYRITVDRRTGYLYWGDVGPDAQNDSLETRGPRGYDEINQARKAGNFGWPYFVGDNYAYHAYDYATGVSGPAFDPDNVVNNSRNNTGIKNLPPAQPAFIWYPYSESPDFPIVGSGGRTAMAGPVYYKEDYPAKTRYPDYYDKKLFVYDWIRNWIFAATLNAEGDLQTLEHFMGDKQFNNISDMEMGRDGQLYVVEYGTGGWFAKNPNAELSVLAYNGGNRAPIAELRTSDLSSSKVPFTVDFSADGSSDPDGDQLKFSWDFGDGSKEETDSPGISHTYQKTGVYAASVTVTDGKGGMTNSETISIYSGNARPKVGITIESKNPVFYFPKTPLSYKVTVTDDEDGNSDSKDFDLSRLDVQINYFTNPGEAKTAIGHNIAGNSTMAGRLTMESLDCQSCHQVDDKSRGPEFIQISERYRNRNDATAFLAEKMINGSVGDWGEVPMPSHPDLAQADAEKIADWILSLTADKNSNKNISPLKGTFVPSDKFKLTDNGVVTITASYADKGNKNVPSLSGDTTVMLRSPNLPAALSKSSPSFSPVRINRRELKVINGGGGWIAFSGLNMTSVKGLQIHYALRPSQNNKWDIEVRLDRPDGEIIGRSAIAGTKPSGDNRQAMSLSDSRILFGGKNIAGDHDLYVVVKNVSEGTEQDKPVLAISSVTLLDQ